MNQLNRRRRQTADHCDCLTPMIRIFGVITAAVVCGVGVDIYVHGYTSGIYILIGSGLVLVLETKWIVTLFLELLFASERYSNFLKYWSVCRIAGGWRLAPAYALFGTALIIWPNNLWLSYIAGGQLLVLAALRLCTLCRMNYKVREEGLLPHCEFEKVDGFSDVADEFMQDTCPTLEEEEPIDDVC